VRRTCGSGIENAMRERDGLRDGLGCGDVHITSTRKGMEEKK
jgi:hypothetical protein